eukprot:69513_1
MADDACESLIQITDILAELANNLNEPYQFMKIVINILENHSNQKIEKHEKARQSCIAATGFLLYGIQPDPEMEGKQAYNNAINTLKIIPHHVQMSTPIGALSNSNDDDDDDEKNNNKEKQPPKAGTKLSKNMQRKYLLENKEFISSFGNILKHGVTDKSESTRKKSFKLLQTLENENNGTLLENLLNQWDFTIQNKYKKWKKLNERKKNSSIKSKKKNKKKKNRKLQLKNQVKKNKTTPKTNIIPVSSD